MEQRSRVELRAGRKERGDSDLGDNPLQNTCARAKHVQEGADEATQTLDDEGR